MILDDFYPARPHLRAKVAQRFWSKVAVGAADECWPWTGSTDRKGYGKLTLGSDRSPGRAPRIAYMLAHGEVQDDLLVCHTCDVPACCNPRHLWQGTAQQNTDDMLNKGRHPGPPHFVGEAHPGSKITLGQARQIKAYIGRRASRKELAERFGVSVAIVNNVLSGKSWRHA